MAYRFKSKEPVPDGIARIVREEIEAATGQLTKGKSGSRDDAIHEARKSIKKIRGALRLMQPELGRMYREEDDRLRETGRCLSELRDAKAIIEVFDGLVGKYQQQLRPEAIRPVRRGLMRNKRETEQRLKVDNVVRGALSALKAVSKDIDKWPLKNDGFAAIGPGLKNRYKRGRQAMAAARRHSAPETYHEWRKRVKDHWYHIRLLESSWTKVLEARESALKDLETWLGDDHNLFVLREKLEAEPEQYGGGRNAQVFTSLMEEYSHELREKSLSLGERIYEQKPRAFIDGLSQLWSAWQDRPTSMKNEQREQRVQKKSTGRQVKDKTAA